MYARTACLRSFFAEQERKRIYRRNGARRFTSSDRRRRRRDVRCRKTFFLFLFNAIMIFLLYQMTGQFRCSIFGSKREEKPAKSNSRFAKFSPVAFLLL